MAASGRHFAMQEHHLSARRAGRAIASEVGSQHHEQPDAAGNAVHNERPVCGVEPTDADCADEEAATENDRHGHAEAKQRGAPPSRLSTLERLDRPIIQALGPVREPHEQSILTITAINKAGQGTFNPTSRLDASTVQSCAVNRL